MLLHWVGCCFFSLILNKVGAVGKRDYKQCKLMCKQETFQTPEGLSTLFTVMRLN